MINPVFSHVTPSKENRDTKFIDSSIVIYRITSHGDAKRLLCSTFIPAAPNAFPTLTNETSQQAETGKKCVGYLV